MADTNRAWAALLALLADNTGQAISPQDVRDALYSLSQIGGGMSVAAGTTTVTLNGTNWVAADLADFTNHASSVGVVADKANNRLILPAVAGVYWLLAAMDLKGSTNALNYGIKFQKDGTDIPGAVFAAGARQSTANAGNAIVVVAPIVHDGTGNGYVTAAYNCSAGTPTQIAAGGFIWIAREA